MSKNWSWQRGWAELGPKMYLLRQSWTKYLEEQDGIIQ